MSAEYLLEKFHLFLQNLLLFTEKNIICLEGNPLIRLQELVDRTRDLIEYTSNGGDGNQMWQYERESLYDNIVSEYFQIMKELSSTM
jgi:hypothetical protein